MAKRNPNHKAKAELSQAEINRLFAHADDETQSPPIFANQAQISVSPEEVTIDFYRAGPRRGEMTGKAHIAFVQRIIMPPSAAARFAEVFSTLLQSANTETPETTETLDKSE